MAETDLCNYLLQVDNLLEKIYKNIKW